MEQNAKIYEDLEKILVTREEIAEKVRELGRRITADYAGKEPVLVCILKGAVLFFSDLIREIDLPLTADFMAISFLWHSYRCQIYLILFLSARPESRLRCFHPRKRISPP